jgi:hypothetical protein
MRWTAKERRTLAPLRTPSDIQRFLDDLDYDERAGGASPRAVMRDGKANCFSGVLFACAALRELGHPPRLAYLDAVSDDGHCLALYQSGGTWGALAKSNFTTLRSREPVYPSYLALGLSYFDGFFNLFGKRTMRSFTEPVELEPFERRGWRFADDDLPYVDEAIDTAPKAWTLPRRKVKEVSPVTPLLREAGLLGSNPDGLWRPKK